MITIEITNETHEEVANLMSAAQRAEIQAKRIMALLVEGSGNDCSQVVETSFTKDESGKWMMTCTTLSDIQNLPVNKGELVCLSSEQT